MRANIKPLTTFRFFAALVVVIFHYDRPHLFFPFGFGNFGYEAVTFFFILSGFILTYTHGSDGGLNVSKREFAISRASRIAPAYLLALMVSAPFFVTSNLKAGSSDNIWLGIFLVPSMLQSWWPSAALLWNGPAWSLSNEAFFYALYPSIWSVWRRLPTVPSLLASYALVVAVSLIRSSCPDDTQSWVNFAAYFPLLNLPQFILGVTLGKTFLANGPASRSNVIFATSTLLLCLVITNKSEHPWLANNAVLCIIFSAIVFSLAGVQARMKSILSADYLVKLGEASYAIYILHFPIWLWWYNITAVSLNLQLRPEVDFIIYVSIVLLVSIATLQLVERPLRTRISMHLNRAGRRRIT